MTPNAVIIAEFNVMDTWSFGDYGICLRCLPILNAILMKS